MAKGHGSKSKQMNIHAVPFIPEQVLREEFWFRYKVAQFIKSNAWLFDDDVHRVRALEYATRSDELGTDGWLHHNETPHKEVNVNTPPASDSGLVRSVVLNN